MNNDVILVGGFHETIELIQKCGLNLIGIIDHSGKHVSTTAYSYLGSDAEFLEANEKKEVKIIISPDIPKVRRKLSELYLNSGYQLGSLVAGFVSESAKIGGGVVIQDQAYVSSMVNLGNGVKINVGAKVMHDCVIGDFTTVAPSAVVLGNVAVGKNCYIGANSTILPNIKILDDVTIGAGAVVTCDIAAGATVKGVPAK